MRLPSICIKQHIYLLKVGKSIKLVSTLDHLKIINFILVCLAYYTSASGDVTQQYY